MGEDIASDRFTKEDRLRYRRKVRRCLDALNAMLSQEHFSFPRQHMGMEIELNLVDGKLDPAMCNTELLRKIDNPLFTAELGQHNLEINVAPTLLAGDWPSQLERDLGAILASANARAAELGAQLVMIGMLPTLREEHFDPKWFSPVARYSILNEQIIAARGEHMILDMRGSPFLDESPETLHSYAISILPESACTSLQLHLQVAPKDFAAHWNAAQCLAGVQVALAANSPFLLGKALWQETRIPLFQQATDTRPEELRNQGVRPRVWFGEKWVTSIYDLFEENSRYFPILLPEVDDEDPIAELRFGRVPKLSELRLHNGTIWRWNRPVYDVVDGVPHVRVENRVLPAGPTITDLVANALFFYGAQRALTTQECPLWTRMSFATAERNFYDGARHGMRARLYWPGLGWVRPDELVLRELLPLAHDGLRDCGVPDAARQRCLGVIERRALTRRTGAVWQRQVVRRLEDRGADRAAALTGMLRRYVELSNTGEPVHSWPVE